MFKNTYIYIFASTTLKTQMIPFEVDMFTVIGGGPQAYRPVTASDS